MPALASDEPGSVYFNFGDPSLGEVSRPGAAFARLVAYAPFTPRVLVPGTMLLRGGPVFSALQHAPQLLQEGVVVPDRDAAAASFAELAEMRGLDPEAIERGRWIDEAARDWRPFSSADLRPLYLEQVLDDLKPGGPFERWMRRSRRKFEPVTIARVRANFEAGGLGSPEALNNAVHTVAVGSPDLARRVGRWGRFRYYTVPGISDTTHIRELPGSIGSLAPLVYGLTASAGSEKIRPFADAERSVSAWIPAAAASSGAPWSAIADACLSVRGEIPDARRITQQLVTDADARELSAGVSELFEAEYAKQVRAFRRVKRAAGVLTAASVLLAFLRRPEAAALGLMSTLTAAGLAADQPHKSPWVVATDKISRIRLDQGA